MAQAYDTAAYKIAADDLLAAHEVDILFHALGAGVVMHDDRRINALIVETKAGRQAIRAGVHFYRLLRRRRSRGVAGAPFEVGDDAGSMLLSSMMFRLNGIDPEKAGDAWRTIPALMEKAEASGTHRFPRKAAIVRPQRSQIEWRVNFTQLAREDGTAVNGLEPDQMTRGEIEGRRQAVRAFGRAPCRVSKNPTSSIYLPQLGIRETRRVVGGYMLSGEDVLGCASLNSISVVNGWPMKSHVAGDVIFKFPPIPESRGFNELPYGILVPAGIDNLLMAGRCASMTHDGQSASPRLGCWRWAKPPGSAAALALSGIRFRATLRRKAATASAQQGAFIGRDQSVPEGL